MSDIQPVEKNLGTANLSVANSAGTPHHFLVAPQNWLDRVSVFLADHSSALLVKETRQALKSRQFMLTFGLLLLAMLAWSFWGVSWGIMRSSLQQSMDESGPVILAGYFFILGVPLAIIIPYAAFRSLSREFEDDTLQLVSITTMSARGIIAGKLGSAVLQMIVYLSALVPGIAFSYLLQGVDIQQIAMLLVLATTGSLFLTTLGLVFSGLCRGLFLRLIMHLALLAVVVFAYFMFDMFVGAFLAGGEFTGHVQEVTSNCYFASFLFLVGGYLCFEVAVGLISFPSDNRSTRIRLAIFVFLGAIVTSVIGIINVISQNEQMDAERPLIYAMVGQFLIAHVMVLLGLMIVSEWPYISQRVRRQIPKNIVGQFLYGMFLPGPGRGYLFSISMIWGWTLGLIMVGFLDSWHWSLVSIVNEITTNGVSRIWSMPGGGPDWLEILNWAAIHAIFATNYLSIVYILVRLLHRWIPKPSTVFGFFLGVVMYILMLVGSFSTSWLVGFEDDYNALLYFNWHATFSQALTPSVGTQVFAALVANASLMVALVGISMILASRELCTPPVSVPEKVKLEIEARKQKPKTAIQVETIEEIFADHQKATNPI